MKLVKADLDDAADKTQKELVGIIASVKAKFNTTAKRELTDEDTAVFLIEVIRETYSV